jgi:hypothetical protein
MNSATHRSLRMGLLALLFALPACSSSKSTSNGNDASPDGRDGPASLGQDSAPDQANADVVGVDAVRAGEVPGVDVTTVDGGFADAPIFIDAPILLDASVKDLGVDAGATDPIDVSVDNGLGLDGGETNSTEAGGTDLGAGEVLVDNFSCSTPVPPDAGISQRLCNDFSNPASARDLVPEAGTWNVAGGIYTAIGPPDQVTCPPGGGTVMTASVLAGLSAQNVRVHAKMTSVVGVDKLLVLRSRPGGNRIEINFRANYVYNGTSSGGDLNVSDLVDCVDVGDYIQAGGPNSILIPHEVGQAIVADVQLIGQQLTIAVDGKVVFDGSLPLSTTPGSVGFAVFRNSVVLYDDFLVDVLD